MSGSKLSCYHCGDRVVGTSVKYDEKDFCCDGCKSVYQILNANELDGFYELNQGGGVKPEKSISKKYLALDIPEVYEDFLEFKNEHVYKVTLFLPAIHCSSCIYLLENLQKINDKIVSSEANFSARTVEITIKTGKKLSEVAQLLENIGYKPELRKNQDSKSSYDKKLLYRLGIAGFAFGSVMLWTFPEYLGLDETFSEFRNFSAYLSLLVSIPVLFYSAWEYIKSAFIAIKTSQLNLDIPIALGILVLFISSATYVVLGEGSGYIDSFTGFVFFLLIGKWFQSKSYQNLSFDNDPKAFFPLGVHKINQQTEEEEITIIDNLKKEDEIILYNHEIIPCDAVLIDGTATIDTSFITGESDLIKINPEDKVYAGSRLIGSSQKFKVVSATNRSKFASIWGLKQRGIKGKSVALEREHRLTKIFLIAVFLVALAGGVLWSFKDLSRVPEIITAILVVACPCALALSFPFVYGNALRKLGKNGIFFKNTYEVEKLNNIDHIIFDKTGTLTKDKTEGVVFSGELTQDQIDIVYAGTKESIHPYSKSINKWLEPSVLNGVEVNNFKEFPGKGWEFEDEKGNSIKLGSSEFLGVENQKNAASFLVINDELKGYFSFNSQLRDGILETIDRLKENYKVSVLSGDNETDLALFESVKENVIFKFRMSPIDKREYIRELKNNKDSVLFIGDGLNDTEALNEADLGISVADDVFRFTPSCDAIIKGDEVNSFDSFIKFGKYAANVLLACMLFSLMYNIVGMSFALIGYVTPLFAAILMPLSSISIVFLSTFLIVINKLK